MADHGIELLQFPYSHFNEKARWALDFKGAPHVRHDYLPGPHAPAIKRLTGQTLVPVVRFDGELVAGSAAIIDELERRFPEPALVPTDAGLRKRALEVQAHFDDHVGPSVRRALFSVLTRCPDYMCSMFSSDRSWPVRTGYRAMFPVARIMMDKAMNISDEAAVERAYAETDKALNFVADSAGPDGHLVGDTFTVADLAAASLLAPTADPPDSPMHRPRPLPELMVRWHERWEKHPGVAWVLDMYRRHRAPRAGRAASAGGSVAA